MTTNRIIFLDYDGVANNYLWGTYLDGHKEPYFHCAYAFPEDNFVNNYQALCWLNSLYYDYPYDIVVTSTWRDYDNYKECLYNGGLDKDIKILGKVDRGLHREALIIEWLKDNDYSGTYTVVDDDASFYLGNDIPRNNIVIVDGDMGITEWSIQKIIRSFKIQEGLEEDYSAYLAKQKV